MASEKASIPTVVSALVWALLELASTNENIAELVSSVCFSLEADSTTNQTSNPIDLK
jgi:hypothetical protein